jgi:hypothetical protein
MSLARLYGCKSFGEPQTWRQASLPDAPVGLPIRRGFKCVARSIIRIVFSAVFRGARNKLAEDAVDPVAPSRMLAIFGQSTTRTQGFFGFPAVW